MFSDANCASPRLARDVIAHPFAVVKAGYSQKVRFRILNFLNSNANYIPKYKAALGAQMPGNCTYKVCAPDCLYSCHKTWSRPCSSRSVALKTLSRSPRSSNKPLTTLDSSLKSRPSSSPSRTPTCRELSTKSSRATCPTRCVAAMGRNLLSLNERIDRAIHCQLPDAP